MSSIRELPDSSAQADDLRAIMVARMRDRGGLRTDRVAQAFLTVPRHVFAPEVPVETAYALDVIRTKFDERGVAISSVSAPDIQALMLEQARIEPGMRVLEIGSGGYHAALLAELVGPDGGVVSVDIDPDIVARAERCLAAAGYPQVRVLQADAEYGVPELAPFDRILVTVGAWDIPPAWTDQLTHGGRLVVPLRLRGLTRSIALARADGHADAHAGGCWVSRDNQMCGFVPMQGAGARDEHVLDLHEHVRLRIDGDQVAEAVDADGLRAALLGSAVDGGVGWRWPGWSPLMAYTCGW